MDPESIQLSFFRHIRSLLPPHVSMVDEIADILGISTDSAYRRIRGEKPLMVEELQKLSMRFNISLDQLLHLQSTSLVFGGNLVSENGFSYAQYLQDLLQQFVFMNGFTNRHIYALVKDIPPMHHFQVPELAAFRGFFWCKSILYYNTFRGKKFSVKDINDYHPEATGKIISAFCRIPTTEIWNIETVNSTLRQIRFYRDTGTFASPEDVQVLYEKLGLLIDHIEKQAELGLKFRIGEKPAADAAPYILMNNELILGDNTFFCELDSLRVTYINHSIINFMMTRDERFNNYMYDTLQNLIKKSTQISSVGEKERSRFFNRIREKVQQAMKNG